MISKLKSWGFVSVAGFSRYTGKTASKRLSTLLLLKNEVKDCEPGPAGEAYFLWYRQSVALMPGGHFLCNETKEAKFTSVPLRRHKVRYAPAPCTGAIRPLPCVGSSGKSHACFGCSVGKRPPDASAALATFPGRWLFPFYKEKRTAAFAVPPGTLGKSLQVAPPLRRGDKVHFVPVL